MKRLIITLAAAAALAAGSTASAAKDLVEEVLEICKPEIEKYCSDVTLGEGRLLACFYAHEDKLSAECSYGLYRAVNTLEQAVAALEYVASACQSDIRSHCAEVQPGEGRIVGCLKKKSDKVSDGCKTAMDAVIVE